MTTRNMAIYVALDDLKLCNLTGTKGYQGAVAAIANTWGYGNFPTTLCKLNTANDMAHDPKYMRHSKQ